MIRKTRLNFILMAMTLVLAVMLVMMVVTILLTFSNSRWDTYNMLSNALFLDENNNQPNEALISKQRVSFLVCIPNQNGGTDVVTYGSVLGPFSSQINAYNVKDDFLKKVVDGSSIDADYVSSDNVYYGHVDKLYYVAEKNPDNNVIKFAVYDRTENEQSITQLNLGLFVLLLVGLVVIFFLVWYFSFKMVKPVQDAFDKQNQFISDASHELKTPITIIRANAEVIEGEESNEWAQNIISQTDRMSYMVNEMLSLAKLAEQPVQKVKFDLSETVESTFLEFEPLCYEQNKKFVCQVEPNLRYFGVAEDVRRVCNILCDNAVKYCDSYVSVRLYQTSKSICINVVNDGCQVPSEDGEKLFGRFYRQDTSRTRSTGGSGLGLSIVNNICQVHKWKINLTCQMGGQMNITIEL